MPTFELTSPSGKKYRVNAPEGATPDQAYDVLKQHLAQNPDVALPGASEGPVERQIVGGVRGAGRGLASDVVQAGEIAQGLAPGLASTVKSIPGVGSGARALKQFANAPSENVGESIGRVVGSAAPFAALGPEGIAARMAVGSGAGALQPAGTPGERALNTGVGALGGMIPGLSPSALDRLAAAVAAITGFRHGGPWAGLGGAGGTAWLMKQLGLDEMAHAVMSRIPSGLAGAGATEAAAPTVRAIAPQIQQSIEGRDGQQTQDQQTR